MTDNNVVIRFNGVSFAYNDAKVILNEANFSVHRNSIVTIIGQNGAGKSTIFKLLLGKLTPQSGKISVELGTTIGIAEQVIPADKLDLSVADYFKTPLPEIKRMFKSLKQTMDEGIFECCGMKVVRHQYFGSVALVGNDEREAMLEQAKRIAETI